VSDGFAAGCEDGFCGDGFAAGCEAVALPRRKVSLLIIGATPNLGHSPN